MASGSGTEASKSAHNPSLAFKSDNPSPASKNAARVSSNKRKAHVVVAPIVATASSSSNASPSTHPLNKAALALTAISSSQNDAERVARLQDAAQELGFELPEQCCQSDKHDLGDWLDEQCHLYGSLCGKMNMGCRLSMRKNEVVDKNE